MRPPEPGSAEDWLRRARADLDLARLVTGKPGILPEHICFHAQQAAEKAVKAVLILRGVEFPRVHDLEELLEVVRGAGMTIPTDVDDIGALTPYAVAARYPGEMEAPTSDEVQDALLLAAATVDWATTLVGG